MQYHGKNSGRVALSFSIMCQINLTKNPTRVENIDKTSSLQKMANLDKSALAGALMLGAAMTAGPALAESKNPSLHLASATVERIENCGAFVKGQRELAAGNGTPMSRSDTVSMLADCRGGQLEARMAEQNRVIAAFDEELRKIGLRVDNKSQILDEHNRAIAQIISINGQWVIQQRLETEIASSETKTAASRERQAQMVQEAKRILQRLATS